MRFIERVERIDIHRNTVPNDPFKPNNDIVADLDLDDGSLRTIYLGDPKGVSGRVNFLKWRNNLIYGALSLVPITVLYDSIGKIFIQGLGYKDWSQIPLAVTEITCGLVAARMGYLLWNEEDMQYNALQKEVNKRIERGFLVTNT